MKLFPKVKHYTKMVTNLPQKKKKNSDKENFFCFVCFLAMDNQHIRLLQQQNEPLITVFLQTIKEHRSDERGRKRRHEVNSKFTSPFSTKSESSQDDPSFSSIFSVNPKKKIKTTIPKVNEREVPVNFEGLVNTLLPENHEPVQRFETFEQDLSNKVISELNNHVVKPRSHLARNLGLNQIAALKSLKLTPEMIQESARFPDLDDESSEVKPWIFVKQPPSVQLCGKRQHERILPIARLIDARSLYYKNDSLLPANLLTFMKKPFNGKDTALPIERNFLLQTSARITAVLDTMLKLTGPLCRFMDGAAITPAQKKTYLYFVEQIFAINGTLIEEISNIAWCAEEGPKLSSTREISLLHDTMEKRSQNFPTVPPKSTLRFDSFSHRERK